MRELQDHLGAGFEVILTNNRGTVVSVDRNRFPARARVSRIFNFADSETIRQLSLFISGGGRLPTVVKKFIHEKAPAMNPRRGAGARLRTKGAVYDLGPIAARVWLRYFSGLLETRITWGKYPTHRPKRSRRRSIRYGTYDRDLDLVTIHPALDCARVPVEFVEYVVYHEMLHKISPPRVSADGAVRFHTKEFKAKERLFKGYDTLMKWQKENIWKSLAPAPERKKA
ncbi:MAG: hypothetical protein OEZ04_01815 [Nitrospinota bacterium]|nr:hypothetical protein [Nitrospinota bacterium]